MPLLLGIHIESQDSNKQGHSGETQDDPSHEATDDLILCEIVCSALIRVVLVDHDHISEQNKNVDGGHYGANTTGDGGAQEMGVRDVSPHPEPARA